MSRICGANTLDVGARLRHLIAKSLHLGTRIFKLSVDVRKEPLLRLYKSLALATQPLDLCPRLVALGPARKLLSLPGLDLRPRFITIADNRCPGGVGVGHRLREPALVRVMAAVSVNHGEDLAKVTPRIVAFALCS